MGHAGQVIDLEELKAMTPAQRIEFVRGLPVSEKAKCLPPVGRIIPVPIVLHFDTPNGPMDKIWGFLEFKVGVLNVGQLRYSATLAGIAPQPEDSPGRILDPRTQRPAGSPSPLIVVP